MIPDRYSSDSPSPSLAAPFTGAPILISELPSRNAGGLLPTLLYVSPRDPARSRRIAQRVELRLVTLIDKGEAVRGKMTRAAKRAERSRLRAERHQANK